MAFSAQGHEKLSFILSTMASAIGIWAIQQRSMTIENDTTPLDFNSLLQQVNTALNVLICSDRLVTPQVDHRDSSSLLSPLYYPYSAESEGLMIVISIYHHVFQTCFFVLYQIVMNRLRNGRRALKGIMEIETTNRMMIITMMMMALNV